MAKAASPVRSKPRRGPVRGSRRGRPIMVLLDLFGRRWSLRILWELRDRSMTSRALRAACDEASPTVLNERLKELREAGFIELVPANGYGLTALGRELQETLLPLHRFAERWGKAGNLFETKPAPVIASASETIQRKRAGLLRRYRSSQ
jgi:DNA-binding HxlR family transcriptional regulator